MIPAHEIKELRKEQFASDLSWLALPISRAPGIPIFGIFITRESNHLLGVGVDQKLHILHRWHLFQTGGIKLYPTVFEGYRGLIYVRKELSTNNFISFITEAAVFNELRSRRRVMNGGLWQNKLLLIKIHL